MEKKRPYAEMPYKEYKLRLEKCKELMEEYKIDALLLFSPTNIRYYTGLVKTTTATAPRWRRTAIIPLDGDPVLLGRLGKETARMMTWLEDIRDVDQILDTTPYVDSCVETIKDLNLHNKVLGIDIDPWWPGMFALDVSPLDIESIKRRSPNARFVEAYQLCREQRFVKTEYEIEIFRKCCEITVEAFEKAFTSAKEGMTEPEISLILWQTFMSNGGLDDSLLIGRMSVNAYDRLLGMPVKRKLKRGDILTYNGGGCYRGYHSDVSRILSFGEPSEQQKKVFEAARRGTDAAYEAFKPGNKASDVYNAAVKAAKEFYPGIKPLLLCGHGIGLDSHEPPMLSAKYDTLLKPGVVCAIEILIGDPERRLWGGVVENDLVVTEDGNENMCEKMSRDVFIV